MPYDTIQSRHKERASHPATFPLDLPLRCLKLSGIQPGEIALDPFAGIGTTLKAAKIVGCDSIGYEIDPGYVGYYEDSK
jgi:site-specific DNA-methyltransferase (adenine-specific)